MQTEENKNDKKLIKNRNKIILTEINGLEQLLAVQDEINYNLKKLSSYITNCKKDEKEIAESDFIFNVTKGLEFTSSMKTDSVVHIPLQDYNFKLSFTKTIGDDDNSSKKINFDLFGKENIYDFILMTLYNKYKELLLKINLAIETESRRIIEYENIKDEVHTTQSLILLLENKLKK